MQLVVTVAYRVRIGIGLRQIGVPNPLLWGIPMRIQTRVDESNV